MPQSKMRRYTNRFEKTGKPIPRKLLIVEKQEASGELYWNVLFEMNDKTFSFQTTRAAAEEILDVTFDKVMEVLVQRGLGKPIIRERKE